MVTQSGLLMIFAVATIVVVAGMAWATWKLLKTIENLANRVEESLRQFERTAEEIRKSNAVLHEIMTHAQRSVANVEHVTEGVRKLRKTLDVTTGVLDFGVLPVLGTVVGVLAGSKAAVSYVVNRIFRKEGRHGE